MMVMDVIELSPASIKWWGANVPVKLFESGYTD